MSTSFERIKEQITRLKETRPAYKEILSFYGKIVLKQADIRPSIEVPSVEIETDFKKLQTNMKNKITQMQQRMAEMEKKEFDCYGSATSGFCDQLNCLWRKECLEFSVK